METKKQTEKNMWELFFKNNNFYRSKLDKRKKEIKFLLKKHTEKELMEIQLNNLIRSNNKKEYKNHKQIDWAELKEIVRTMRRSKNTSYLKIFIQGNNHIYLASPIYQHKDYNKSTFCLNTPHNWDICKKANEIILGYEKINN